jgi:hypothetical protein
MPPDVAADVRILLYEHPDQRDYILDELAGEGPAHRPALTIVSAVPFLAG